MASIASTAQESLSMRIAVAGFQHETNTFAPVKADYDAFEREKNYPKLLRGSEVVSGLRGKNIPLAGAIAELEAAGADIVPVLWCMATPSAHVTADAFERIAGEIVDGIAAAGRIDGVLLELHGAMVAECADDGEGEVLARLRARIGDTVPVAVPLDLHANITPAMVQHADLLDAYRYYPHTDMAETGARTARHLLAMVRSGTRPAKAFRQIPFLIPINGGCSEFGPAREIYKEIIPALEAGSRSLTTVSFAPGFPLADFADVGPSVLAYAETQQEADAAADRLAAEVMRREAQFIPDVLAAEAAVAKALELARSATRPVVIADTQDNPGGGGTGDTTGLLRALVAAKAKGAVIGALIDPQAAAKAHEIGEGQRGRIAIGGKLWPGDQPVEANVLVRKVSSGSWKASGAMKAGMTISLGKVALIEIEPEGVLVALASVPAQTVDRSIFAHLGLVPEDVPIIALKSSVHFRADFTPLASHILVALAPGPVAVDNTTLEFRKIRPGARLMPSKAG